MYTYVIIDDEELTRKGTIKKLSPMNSQITCIGEAENGQDGIRKIEELNPDIIVLDMQMPVMDGMELLPYLNEHYPEKPLIVISGYRNFDYIKRALSANAVDYVLKPFSREDIQKCMKNAISRLEDQIEIESRLLNSEEEKQTALYEYDLQILRGLILGYHTETTTLSSQKLKFINQVHRSALFTMYFDKIPDDSLFRSFLDTNQMGDLFVSISDPNDRQLIFGLIFLPEDGVVFAQPYLEKNAGALADCLEQQGYSAVIGVSRVHRDLSELKEAFTESVGALNMQSVKGTPSGFYTWQETEPKSVLWDRQDEFLFRMESGSTEEIRMLTDELFLFYQGIPDFTLADAKYNCYLLSGECRRNLAGFLDQPEGKTDSESMQNITRHIYRLPELKRYYLQFFLNLTSLMKEEAVYSQTDVIENIKIYMERNYQKNLTQEVISYLFYINRSYLSTLFKARTGEKFIDYLNEIRIRKAKELLRSTDRKMYHIAKSVGYDNVKYFFRIFKKKTGQTPEQYREKNPQPNKTTST